MRTIALLGVLLPVTLSAAIGAADPRKAFIKAWEGRHVVVQNALHTLVYDEQGWGGHIDRGRRDGLTVVTHDGVFFRFEGRSNEPDATGRSPQEVLERVKGMYNRAHVLDVGSFQMIQPSFVASYDPGATLVVKTVRIDVDRVRVVLANPAAADKNEQQLATTLTIQWPTALSQSLTERPEIERLLGQFLAVAGSR